MSPASGISSNIGNVSSITGIVSSLTKNSMKTNTKSDKIGGSVGNINGSRINRIPFHKRHPQDCLTFTLTSASLSTAMTSAIATTDGDAYLTSNSAMFNNKTTSMFADATIFGSSSPLLLPPNSQRFVLKPKQKKNIKMKTQFCFPFNLRH